MRAGRSCAMLVFELLAFGAAVQNVDIVRCGAVQGFIAGQPIEAARGIAAFDGATYLPCVRLEHRAARAIPSLDPTHFGVHAAARAERCRAMRGGVPAGSWGWVGPSLGGGPGKGGGWGPVLCLLGLALGEAFFIGVESGPTHIKVARLLCWVLCLVRCRVWCWVRCRVLGWWGGAGRCMSSHSSASEMSAQRRPFPLPCLLVQRPGFWRCGAGSSDPRAS